MPRYEIEDFEDSTLVAFLDSYKMRMEMLDDALKEVERMKEMLKEMEQVRWLEGAMCPFCGFYEHGPECPLRIVLSEKVEGVE